MHAHIQLMQHLLMQSASSVHRSGLLVGRYWDGGLQANTARPLLFTAQARLGSL